MADGDQRPLVSCVVPTRDRPGFLAKAVEHWTRQTYPNREMIIVDDSPAPWTPPEGSGLSGLSGLSGVTHLRVPPMTQGAKLNLGITHARGSVLHKWDDDDIYAPAFLETAVGALRRAETGFVLWDCYLFLLGWSGEVRFSGHGHKAGPSLCFTRETWAKAPFRPIPNAVDSYFIADHGHRFTAVCGFPELLIAVRHRANTWRRFWDTDVDAYLATHLEVWDEPLAGLVVAADLAFYEGLRDTPLDRPGTVDLS